MFEGKMEQPSSGKPPRQLSTLVNRLGRIDETKNEENITQPHSSADFPS